MILRAIRHRYRITAKYRKARRYARLLREVEARRPRSIVEVGVFTGDRAREMIDAAALHHPPGEIEYFGFDLFDHFTPGILEAELSKEPLSQSEVAMKLARTGARVDLTPGWSQDTLPTFVEQRARAPVDFVFIDGGHAVETIRSDWENLSSVTDADTAVLFDDYYVDCPHLTDRFGCNRVLEELDAAVYDWDVITDPDCFDNPDGLLKVALARVWRR